MEVWKTKRLEKACSVGTEAQGVGRYEPIAVYSFVRHHSWNRAPSKSMQKLCKAATLEHTLVVSVNTLVTQAVNKVPPGRSTSCY
jgi:hypothetical protein